MLEQTGDIFQHINELREWGKAPQAFCITTNGTVKKNGSAVMGAGIAKQIAGMFPTIPKSLGRRINKYGNQPYCFKLISLGDPTFDDSDMVTFPVKHNWWETADLKLIERSTKQLVFIANFLNWDNVWLPRPGCGNGKLQWSDVRPAIESLLDDRFTVWSLD